MRKWLVLFVLLPAGVSFADQIELSTGEVLRGEIVQRTAEWLVLDHPILGRLEIPAQAVRRVDDLPPAQSSPPNEFARDTRKSEPNPAPPTPALAVPTPDPGPRWHSKLEFGFAATEGNSETANLTLAFNTAIDRGHDRYDFDSRYALRSSRGDRSENKLTAGLLAQWPLSNPRWSYFAQSRYDFDEFQSWDHRITGGGGMGYHLIDINDFDPAGNAIDVFDLRIRLGLGLRREFGSTNERIQPEGIFGGDLVWQLNSHQRLAAGTTFFPNLEETGEFRVLTNAEWVLDLDTLDGLSFKLGLAHEFQSLTDPGIEESDLSVYGAFVLDF